MGWLMLDARWPQARRGLAGVLLLLGLLVVSTAAHASWWNADWPYRTKINLDTGPTGAAITDPIGRAPVLVRLHAGNFTFADAKEDGSDLRFLAADDRTPLKFHIDKFDGLVEQVGLIWVDIPDLAPGATTSIYMYYGNQEAAAASDGPGTYDADQLLVYHFADPAGVAHDQTRNGNDSLDPVVRDDAGLIGPGLKLQGGAYVRLPASPSLALPAGQPLTVSMWMKMPGANTGVLYSSGGPEGMFTFGVDRGALFAEVSGPGGHVRTPAGPELTPDSWHHVAVTAGERIVVWVDGAKYAEAAARLPVVGAETMLGGVLPSGKAQGTPAAMPGSGFVGELDEVQIARAARPAGYIEAAARSQGLDSRLVAFDVPEANSGMGTGYFGILLRSVTIDGWVVIVLCGVMMVVCALIMAVKAVTISRVAHANRVFRTEFAKTTQTQGLHPGVAATDLTEERLPVLGRSTLFDLYKTGVDEVAQRVGGEPAGARQVLGPESITAIRAALDSELLRATQRLNAQMVMLTIAISGGPFLGLLGTVIGVMITFAAVAAAGDVNINAIAPGIAAALLATVAGLGVAIPSLFGYNYLLTRIKGQTSMMQLFANELVARIAESYSGRQAAAKG